MYFGKQENLRLPLSLAPRVSKRKHTNKDQHKVISFFYVKPPNDHASGTARLLVKGTRSVAITRDNTWRDLPSGIKRYLNREDAHVEISSDNDSDSSDG